MNVYTEYITINIPWILLVAPVWTAVGILSFWLLLFSHLLLQRDLEIIVYEEIAGIP